MRYCYIGFIFLLFVLFSGGCRKELFTDDPSARLTISTDTIHFDTVFVTVGSATKNFKVTNPHKQALNISSIRLAGGPNSPYRINIDGRPTTLFTNYELAAGDSMYVFIEVTVDPNNLATPFIVEDSILFETNGNTQKIILSAYGQNAHFFNNEFIECNAVWTNDKPYVIYDSIAIRPGCKLTIEKGVKVYSHKNSAILVLGSIEVNGTKDEPVIFRGDRLEKVYEKEPGQWNGIRLTPKSTGAFKHAIISNAVVGLEADSVPLSAAPTLKIEKSVIRNMTVAGLVGYTARIEAKNVLIHSCEQYTFLGALGGDYKFTNCTIDNTETRTARRIPSFVLDNSDYIDTKNNIRYRIDLQAQFRNCIIFGDLEEEIKLSKAGGGAFNTVFENNIVKSKEVPFGPSNKRNENPRYKNTFKEDYSLDEKSPAINAGVYFPGEFDVRDDIINNMRDDKPDIGCYEFK